MEEFSSNNQISSSSKMDTTVDSIVKEIDDTIESQKEVQTEYRQPVSLPEDKYSSSECSTKELEENQKLLSSPFQLMSSTYYNTPEKMQDCDSEGKELKTLAGSTLTNTSEIKTHNISPQPKEDITTGYTGDHKPDSFSLEATKPLLHYQDILTQKPILKYQRPEVNEHQVDNGCETDVDDYCIQENGSPEIQHSPSKIPLTNSIKINHFARKTSDEMPPSRFSSGSSFNDDIQKLSTNIINTNFDLLSENRANSSEISIPMKFNNSMNSQQGTNQNNVYQSRIFSVSTSIGEYQSAKEEQTRSEFYEGFEGYDTNGVESIASVEDLSISTGYVQGDDTALDIDLTNITHETLNSQNIARPAYESFIDSDREGTRYPSQLLDNKKSIKLISTVENSINSYNYHNTSSNLQDRSSSVVLTPYKLSEIDAAKNGEVIHISDTNFEEKVLSSNSTSDNNKEEEESHITEIPNKQKHEFNKSVECYNTSDKTASPTEADSNHITHGDLNYHFKERQSKMEGLEMGQTKVKTGEANLVTPIGLLTISSESVESIEYNKERESPSNCDEKMDVIRKNQIEDNTENEDTAVQLLNAKEQGPNSNITNSDRHEITMYKHVESLNHQGKELENCQDLVSLDIGDEPLLSSGDRRESNEPNRAINVSQSSNISTGTDSYVLPQLPKIDSLFIDDPLADSLYNSEDSFGDTSGATPKTYIEIWHNQEDQIISKCLGENKSIIDRDIKGNSFAFKPKLVHNKRLHYTDLKPQYIEDANNISLTLAFEQEINKLTAEPPTRSGTIIKRPLNIWTPDTSDFINSNSSSTINIKEVFGEEVTLNQVKSPSNLAYVGTASSIRSMTVDAVDSRATSVNTTLSEGPLLKELSMIENNEKSKSPDKKVEQYSPSKHIGSPFKVNNAPSSKKLITESAEEKADQTRNDNRTYVGDEVGPQNIDLSMDPTSTPNLPESQDNNELVDHGIVYLKLESIKLKLNGIKQHKATFCVEIDNCQNVFKTDYLQQSDEHILSIDKEIEVPIKKYDQKIIINLKCKYQRTESQLVEVVKKVREGRSLGGLGKQKYRYEKVFVEKKVEYDDWDYLFAQDGSCGSASIVLDKEFLDTFNFKTDKSEEIDIRNKWARVCENTLSKKNIYELPRRREFSIGNLRYNACYISRTSNHERFPKSLSIAFNMSQQLTSQKTIKKEGYLLQEGGDSDGIVKKRFFRLHGTEMTGYHEISGNPTITINLLNVSKIVDHDDSKMENDSGRNFTNLVLFGECFQLIFNNGESITFNSAGSVKETRDWYEVIKQCLALNKFHQPWVCKLADI